MKSLSIACLLVLLTACSDPLLTAPPATTSKGVASVPYAGLPVLPKESIAMPEQRADTSPDMTCLKNTIYRNWLPPAGIKQDPTRFPPVEITVLLAPDKSVREMKLANPKYQELYQKNPDYRKFVDSGFEAIRESSPLSCLSQEAVEKKPLTVLFTAVPMFR